MTVKQLREELSKYPDGMGVFFDTESTQFRNGSVEKLSIEEINYKEDPDGPTWATEKNVVIRES